MPRLFDDARACAEEAVAHVGKRIVLGLPLGLGKANRLANAFFDLAAEDPGLSLSIFTGLTLEVPRPAPGLERRFMEPILERLFKGYVELSYAKARREGKLPANVEVREFFLPTATLLSNDYAQHEYVSANYTHVAQLVIEQGINVLAQMVASTPGSNGPRYSLSSNPDLALDVAPAMRADASRRTRILGEINERLPFMPNDAEVSEAWFDSLFEAPPSTLFGTPSSAVSLQDHAIGLNASTLIKDGGTLQIGIGSLADAVSHALLLRHEANAKWRELAAPLQGALSSAAAGALGGQGRFEAGLYGCSEMISDGMLALLERGVLKREVADPAPGDGPRIVDGAFFLGSRDFYERLRRLDAKLLARVNMTSVEKVNGLYGGEAVRRAQRVHARFLNSAMEATALGGAASDALIDGRIVSGVGGQYNFVAMAHEIAGARSILLLRSTKMLNGRLHSNIVWERPNETIPRHLKDVVVSEYGIADLRGQTDAETIKRMLAITDSRFQGPLLEAAKKARKIEPGYTLPEEQTHNMPARLEQALAKARGSGLLPAYPFGTDLTEIEIVLADTLRHLKAHAQSARGLMRLARDGWRARHTPPAAEPYLERLGLVGPTSLRERTLRFMVVAALRETGAIS